MEKQTHFRIIELPTHQVLITKDFDNDEDNTPLLVITLFIDNCRAEIKMGFDNEKKRNEAFINYSEKSAKTLLKTALNGF